MNRSNRPIASVIWLISALPVALLAFSCSKDVPMSGATAWVGGQGFDPLAVEGVTATEGKLVVTIQGSGTVTGIREAVVVSQTQGIVNAVNFSTGDRVRSKQVLVKLDDRLAGFNLKRAQDQLAAAELDLKAIRILSESGGASNADLARAQSAESAARSQYEIAKKTYDDSSVVSPIDGIVASRDVQVTEGNVLATFTPVARIVDNSAFRITIGVGEREIGRIRTGLATRVLIPSAFGDDTVDATVVAVGGGADAQTGNFPVVIGFNNAWGDLVKSGMSAQIEIVPEEGKPSVVVPISSLVRRGDRFALFVEEGGKAKIREVSLGARNGVRAEATSGISAGETIIVSALSRLVDGTPVTVTRRGDSAARE